ncbi:MAG: phosphoribosylformylglycinamidine synthase I [Dehalococcoidia bacterium]|nr:phosphoribosylformylglycinamidine synthase I [Dehalococcoidia bacterium]
MAEVRTIVLRAAGINCDDETKYAFELAGSAVEKVHINRLVRGEVRLTDYQILAFSGGFSYGDDIASGRLLANELKNKLGGQLAEFVQKGGLVIGICNGFQVLVKSGLLPALSEEGSQQVTLTYNESGKFEDRWVYLQAPPDNKCVFLAGIERLYLPVAHGEGRFVSGDDRVLRRLWQNGQAVLLYVNPAGEIDGYPWNPNGSTANIAGICDTTGRVFGLMPHPERFLHYTNHPRWTREKLPEEGDGLRIFRNAVEWVKNSG